MFVEPKNEVGDRQVEARLSSSNVLCLLFGIWALAVLARIFLFTGYMNGDMGNYIQEAAALSDGNYSVQQALASRSLAELIPGPNFNWQNLRIGLIGLEALSMKFFGVNDFSFAFLMFGFFTLGFCMTYAIGSHLHSRGFGVTAAVLFAFVPKEINLATILVPHLPSGALMALSCYLLLRGLDAERQARSGFAAFFMSGVAVGLAYLVHELSILLLPVLVLIFWSRVPLKTIVTEKKAFLSLMVVMCGFAVIFAGEQVYFLATTGVSLLRLKFIAAMGQKWIELNPVDLNTIKYSIYPRAMFASYDYGFFYLLVAAGLATSGYKYLSLPAGRKATRNAFLPPLIWFAFIFLYLQFGSTSLTSYKPVFKIPHYLSFVAVPAALLAAPFPFELITAGIGRLRGRRWAPLLPKLAGLLVLAGFASSSVLFAWVNYSGNGSSRPDITNEQKIKAALDRQGASRVYTDVWTKHGLDFAYGYRNDIVAYNTTPPKDQQAPPDLSALDSGFVVINWIYLSSPYIMAASIPDLVRNPPRNWILVDKIPGQSQSIDIYRIDGS